MRDPSFSRRMAQVFREANDGPHLSPDDIARFVDDEMPVRGAGVALAHISNCPSCREMVAALQESDALAAAPVGELGGALRAIVTGPGFSAAIVGGLLGVEALHQFDFSESPANTEGAHPDVHHPFHPTGHPEGGAHQDH